MMNFLKNYGKAALAGTVEAFKASFNTSIETMKKLQAIDKTPVSVSIKAADGSEVKFECKFEEVRSLINSHVKVEEPKVETVHAEQIK